MCATARRGPENSSAVSVVKALEESSHSIRRVSFAATTRLWMNCVHPS
jgi:hypothetical protein